MKNRHLLMHLYNQIKMTIPIQAGLMNKKNGKKDRKWPQTRKSGAYLIKSLLLIRNEYPEGEIKQRTAIHDLYAAINPVARHIKVFV